MKYMSDKDWIKRQIRQKELEALEESELKNLKEIRRKREIDAINEESNAFYDKRIASTKAREAYIEFKSNLKNNLVCECVYNIYKNSIHPYITESFKNKDINLDAIGRGFVEDFVNEQGVDKLLRTWKRKNVLLREYANIVEETLKNITESLDKNDPSSFGVSNKDKSQFYSNLNNSTPEEVVDTIKTRVISSIETFLDDHKNMKNAVTDIYNQAQTKIASTDDEELKEAYNMRANAAIKEQTSRASNVFGQLCTQLGKNIMYDDNLREQYITEDGRLDTEAIVGMTGMMYTLLETCNTLKLVNVDKEYIEALLEDMKEQGNNSRRKNKKR